jgi:cytochrome c peroxidase
MNNMKGHLKYIVIALYSVIAFVSSCRKDTEPSEKPTTFELQVPKGFPPPYLSDYNPLTVEGIALGRKLFYDNILSSNGRSCNSCHFQEQSFIARNSDLGLDPGLYLNIPALINQAWNKDYGWEGMEPDLDHVAIGDFGPLFFNSDIYKVIAKMKAHAEYPSLFKKAFPEVNDPFTPGILQEKTSFAIAQFLRTIVVSESKYDLFIQGKTSLTDEEEYGHELFTTERGDCFHCHSLPLFSDNAYHNIGLDTVFLGLNKGRFYATGAAKDLGTFGTPALRNVGLTAPYMHDGRFATLDEVIEHYNSGVKKSATLDPIMTKAGKENGLNLTAFEKQCLKKFLLTLTDSSVLTNTKYSKPQ